MVGRDPLILPVLIWSGFSGMIYIWKLVAGLALDIPKQFFSIQRFSKDLFDE